MHYGGFPSRTEIELKKLAREITQLQIVEDAAHACGTKNNEKKIVGSENEFCLF